MLAARQAFARGFHADEAGRALEVRIEDAHGIRAAADAGDDSIGLACRLLLHLHQALFADHRLEVAHHHRVGMRTGHGADDVEGALDVGHPVAHRFVERVLERARTRLHRHDRGAKELHAVDVLRLALHVLGAHVDHALHAVARGDRGGGDAVHAGAGLGDYTRLPHATRKERLADGVVDLVRAGVVEILALDVDLRAAAALGKALRMVDRARASDVVLELVAELGFELRIVARDGVRGAQLLERLRQRLGNEDAAVGAEVAALVGQVIHPHGEPRR